MGLSAQDHAAHTWQPLVVLMHYACGEMPWACCSTKSGVALAPHVCMFLKVARVLSWTAALG